MNDILVSLYVYEDGTWSAHFNLSSVYNVNKYVQSISYNPCKLIFCKDMTIWPYEWEFS